MVRLWVNECGRKENVYKQEAPHMQDTVNKKGYTIDFFHPQAMVLLAQFYLLFYAG